MILHDVQELFSTEDREQKDIYGLHASEAQNSKGKPTRKKTAIGPWLLTGQMLFEVGRRFFGRVKEGPCGGLKNELEWCVHMITHSAYGCGSLHMW